MKKLAKLLALALAVVMLLPAAALAADNSANGPKLVVCGLNWDEGHFANDDDISGRNYGGEEAYITPGDEWAVIFFPRLARASPSGSWKRMRLLPVQSRAHTMCAFGWMTGARAKSPAARRR